MPRPKAILWKKRVEVFLEYRVGGGKVNPVANRHHIARSTVRVIVKEFEDFGFSSQPRAKVSVNLLMGMQEEHVANILKLSGLGVGMLNIGTDTDDEEQRQTALDEPLPVEDESRWHIRDTKIESVIQEATEATRDFLQKESDSWRALSLALEEVCDLPERRGESREDPDPHLLPGLRRILQDAFFDKAFLVELPSPEWLVWSVAPDEAEALILRRRWVAIGSEDNHQRIKEGVAPFLAGGFKYHQRRFSETRRFRQDMVLMQGVVGKSLKEANMEDEIRRGICPACPYPEASLSQDSAAGLSGVKS